MTLTDKSQDGKKSHIQLQAQNEQKKNELKHSYYSDLKLHFFLVQCTPINVEPHEINVDTCGTCPEVLCIKLPPFRIIKIPLESCLKSTTGDRKNG